MKRRRLNIFSLSFLDIITCGLGAVILLFVVINAKSSTRLDEIRTDLSAEVDRMEAQVLEGKQKLIIAHNTLEKTMVELVQTQGLSREIIKTIKAHKIELADRNNDTLATKDHINKLKADLKSLEEDIKRLKAGAKTRDERGTKLRPFPGHGDRHYLTDLKMGGKHIFILVDASASMLDETIIGVIRRRNLSDREKLKSTKWQQAVKTVDWLTTQLPSSSKFQVYTFNEIAGPLNPGTQGSWLDAGDVDILNSTVDHLRKIIPKHGTSLLNAFNAVNEMKPVPDNIFLLVDSLPTMGASKPWRKRVSANKRLSLFNEAIRKLPSGVPVNIILYPMEGDPMAADSYWRLAKKSRGSFFCPARDWP
ncbi:MAG: hypothetical protein PVF56_21445 [Desulfobacterales bacterium]|jgi:hypothetical protein